MCLCLDTKLWEMHRSDKRHKKGISIFLYLTLTLSLFKFTWVGAGEDYLCLKTKLTSCKL